jgi:hypothetical protein
MTWIHVAQEIIHGGRGGDPFENCSELWGSVKGGEFLIAFATGAAVRYLHLHIIRIVCC